MKRRMRPDRCSLRRTELPPWRRANVSTFLPVLLATTAVGCWACHATGFAAPLASTGSLRGRQFSEGGGLRGPGISWKAAPSAIATAAENEVAVPPPSGGAGGLMAFWKFLRPHTIRGTILASSAMVSRVLLENAIAPDWSLLPKAICGVLALLCGNGYIVGISQIYDVSIDVINKPFLPIAAKELSIPQAWFLIIAMAGTGTFLAWQLFGQLIGAMYCTGLFLGTIYSVPPLRLKTSPVCAALIIATVRGFFLNFGVYYACRAALGVPLTWSTPVAFVTCFCFVYALVIAVTKDLPDVQGDLADGIQTFATRFGVDRVALAATCVLLANYAAAIAWVLSPLGATLKPQVLLVAHGILAGFLIRGIRRLRAADHRLDALKAYYKLIWNLFYSEYFIFPFI